MFLEAYQFENLTKDLKLEVLLNIEKLATKGLVLVRFNKVPLILS